MRAIVALVGLALTTVGAPLGSATTAAADEFSDTLVMSLSAPTGLAWTPDGRMLITTQSGRLRVRTAAGVLLSTPAIDLSSRMCSNMERGLLSVAVDPAFSTNRYIYLFWTRKGSDPTCPVLKASGSPVNRVARYTLGSDSRVVTGSEVVIVDHIVNPGARHLAGDLKFGGDGFLYVSVGDDYCQLDDASRCAQNNANASRLSIPHGKILRVTRTGAVPADNPYVGAVGARRCTAASGQTGGSGPCKEIYASGLRNPFRMARQPGSNLIYVNDVGQTLWEEIDQLQKGADYGWNTCEGNHATGTSSPCPLDTAKPPVYEYDHSAGCEAITGGAFVPSWSTWGPEHTGGYVFSDYVCGTIFERAADGTVRTLVSGLGASSAVHLAFNPGGNSLFYTTYANGGQVRRLQPAAANTAPVANFKTAPIPGTQYGVAFDGSSSYDPDVNDAIVSYRWTFGDGASTTTSGPKVNHVYSSGASVVASLVVTDDRGGVSSTYSRDVNPGNLAPTMTVDWPAATARFSVGQTVTLRATGSDPEDGTLPGSSLSWTVRLRHGAHTHPYQTALGLSITLQYPAPEDVAATTTSSLEVTVTATDSDGATATDQRTLLPKTVSLSFATSPSGGFIRANGTAVTTPGSITSWHNWRLNLEAPTQTIGGVSMTCSSWSDGAACDRSILTPATPATYTAVFTET